MEKTEKTKHIPRDTKAKRHLENRINRIIGQLGGIKKMLDEDRYCGDVLTQIAAVESALQSLGYVVLTDHMKSCVVEQIQNNNLDIIDETMTLIKKLD